MTNSWGRPVAWCITNTKLVFCRGVRYEESGQVGGSCPDAMSSFTNVLKKLRGQTSFEPGDEDPNTPILRRCKTNLKIPPAPQSFCPL